MGIQASALGRPSSAGAAVARAYARVQTATVDDLHAEVLAATEMYERGSPSERRTRRCSPKGIGRLRVALLPLALFRSPRSLSPSSRSPSSLAPVSLFRSCTQGADLPEHAQGGAAL